MLTEITTTEKISEEPVIVKNLNSILLKNIEKKFLTRI